MEPANTITHYPWWQLDTLTSGPYFPDSTNIPATGNWARRKLIGNNGVILLYKIIKSGLCPNSFIWLFVVYEVAQSKNGHSSQLNLVRFTAKAEEVGHRQLFVICGWSVPGLSPFLRTEYNVFFQFSRTLCNWCADPFCSPQMPSESFLKSTGAF